MAQVSDQASTLSKSPLPRGFPAIPRAWHYACPIDDLKQRPVAWTVGGLKLVLFFDASQRQIVAMDQRCVHMGADLTRGCVVNGRIRCPFHEWEFDRRGKCVHIPTAEQIPEFARQQVYPTATIGPHVLVLNHPDALIDPPSFDGISIDALLPAAPYEFEAELPWYMVAANAFDIQHFRSAHDRTLVSEPVITQPSPNAYRISARFEVTGRSIFDQITRVVSGSHVTMTVTSFGGSIVTVQAEFARTTTYGLLCVRPIDRKRSQIVNVVWVRRRSGLGSVFDPVDAAVRRFFINQFVESDRARSVGIEYTPGSLIEADNVLADYFRWLGKSVQAETFSCEGQHA